MRGVRVRVSDVACHDLPLRWDDYIFDARRFLISQILI